MMAGNPNWWSINTMHPQSQQLPSAYQESPPQYLYGSSPLNSAPLADHHHTPEYPRAWSQLLLGGVANDPERTIVDGPNYEYKKLENWEGQMLSPSLRVCNDDQVKLEIAQSNLLYGAAAAAEDEFQIARPPWSQVIPASSPTSCVTSLSSSLLNFSNTTKLEACRNQHPETSSECNSSRAGSLAKKPKIQHSTTQPAMKVRKEKLGDRITSLHQLVSPFGKTDTASVLSEAIGYIRFLQAQIEALSSPYFGNAASRSMGLQGCSDSEDQPKDLRSRGLCLVPVSCTLNVGSDNGADYWAPALGGGF